MNTGGNVQNLYRENTPGLEHQLSSIGDKPIFDNVEEFCRKIEKDARRYKRFLGNDSQVILI